VRALGYFFAEASASLWRGRRAAILSVLTIAGGLFVLGFFLALNTNLQRVVGRWTNSAELSVYLKDDATQAQLKNVDELIAKSGMAVRHEYVSKDQAAARFKQDFPDLAAAANQLESSPFPASFEVRLKPDVQEAGNAVDNLAASLSALNGVADVRYDRRWLTRLTGVVRLLRALGLAIVVLLALASAVTVANVVRLATYARQDEIEIMELVGAPLAYVRGPFVVEGVLQGGVGAMVALLLLWAVFAAARARYGGLISETIGLGAITFLPFQICLIIIVGGMLLGCAGGFIVARAIR
jgi:cell division transport system permease protein